MRSHAIVAVVAFAAGALVVTLALQPPAPPPAPLEMQAIPPPADVDSRTPVTVGNPSSSASLAVPATDDPAPQAEMRQPTGRTTACVLGGYVRTGSESRPVERAYVGLFVPALQEDSSTSEFGQWRGSREQAPKRRQLLTYTYTDEEGRFSFSGLTATTYILRAEFGPLVTAVTAPQTLEAGEVRGGILISLPLPGGLDGRLLVPQGISFDGWRVALSRDVGCPVPPSFIDHVVDDMIDARVDEDGRFRLGPAAPGRLRVWLVAFRGPTLRQRAPKLPIGEVDIVAGEDVKRDFDLRQGFPGSFHVTVRFSDTGVDANPPMYSPVIAQPTVLATPRFEADGVQPVSARCTGEVGDVGPVAPGTWSLSVLGGNQAWIYDVPLAEAIGPGETRDVEITVPVVLTTLLCTDPNTGNPVANTFYVLEFQRGPEKRQHFSLTDARGGVRLWLTPGIYTIAFETQDSVPGRGTGLPETFEVREDGAHPSRLAMIPPAETPR